MLAIAAATAAAVGAASVIEPRIAVALTVAVCVLAAVTVRPSAILIVMMATIFLELVSFGGVTLSRLVAPIALLVVLFTATRPGTEIRAAPPLYWALGYATWALASGLWTVAVGGTVFLLASLSISLIWMFAFASLLTTREELDRLIVALAIVSTIVGVLSTLAFIGHPIFGVGVLQEGRVQGGTGDPSFFAAAQLIALPLLLVASGEASGVRRVMLYGAAIVVVGSVLATVSRGGTIELLVIAVILMLLPSRSVFGSRGNKVVVMVLLVLGATAFLARYHADVLPRLQTTLAPKSEQTGSGRVEIWAAARQEAAEHPFIGIGYGAWRPISNDRLVETANIDLSRWKLRPNGSEVHNAFLGTATELGLVGLSLFLGLLIATAQALRRTARRARAVGADFYARIANALVIGLIGWCIGSMFISTETSRPPWIIVGLCLALPKLLERFERDSARSIAGRPLAPPAGSPLTSG